MTSQLKTTPPILRVQGLKKYFPIRRGMLQTIRGQVRAVDGVDFEIPAGKTLGLVGESGCGKSTIARLILRLMKPDQGHIWFNGEDISTWTQQALRPIRRQIQIVFQDPYGSLNPRMTVGQSVAEGFRTLGMPRGAERRNRLDALLEMVGISPASANRYPHEFSGGQRQRVGIARALSVSPSLVICDEPISALDVSIQAQIINLLKDLQDKLGLSYLFISHDLNVVGYLCHTIAVMYQGQIMEYGPAEAIFESPSHPYTRSLLAAVPGQMSEFAVTPESDSTEADTPTAPEAGCKYQSACAHETSTCKQNEISFIQVGPGHFMRCNQAPT